MSDYRRLISYIYAYEGGVKGKNIGFAKIEVRGEQCRIYVSVKKIYVGSNDIGVYLLAPSDEILLGRIFVRGGTGEFRMNVNSSNIEGSGCAMEACYSDDSRCGEHLAVLHDNLGRCSHPGGGDHAGGGDLGTCAEAGG